MGTTRNTRAREAHLPSGEVNDDPEELEEWRDALLSVVRHSGAERACQIMDMLAGLAQKPMIDWQPSFGTPYVNTIPVEA